MLMLLRWEIAGLVLEEGRDLLRKVGSWLLDIKDHCQDGDNCDDDAGQDRGGRHQESDVRSELENNKQLYQVLTFWFSS